MNTRPSIHNTLKLLKIGLVANVLECYEFSIYVFLIPIIGQLFLQSTGPFKELIQACLIFTITYLIRPFGSFLWGYMADHFGRGYSLKTALIIMSIPTVLIGLLPTYHQIGFLSTSLLLILRLIQGFSMGGELAINGCYIYEAAPPKQRSFLCGVVCASSVIGILVGSSVISIIFSIFEYQIILQWAWRIPYLLSILITAWILAVRRSIQEPIQWHKSSKLQVTKPSFQRKSFWDRYQLLLPDLIPGVILGAFMQVSFYVLFMWMPTYLIHFLKLPPAIAHFYNTIGLIFSSGFILLAGYLSSLFGYKRLLLIHIPATLLLIIPLFFKLQSTSYTWLLVSYFLFAWLQSGVPGVMMEILGDAFPMEVRGLGMSLGHTLPAALFGGTAPLICTYMTQKTELLLFPAFYIMGFGSLAFIIALKIPRKPSVSKQLNY